MTLIAEAAPTTEEKFVAGSQAPVRRGETPIAAVGASTAQVKVIPGLMACIEPELALVEERLAIETRSDVAAVRDISGHTLLSGGKRLRPALALLCARTVGGDFSLDRATAAGAAAEMIHMATLMHDDVVDESPERRGRPTANSVYGNGITILTGDFLLAKAISLLVHNEENLRIVRVFVDVTVGMAEGEVLQSAVAHDTTIALDTYEEIIDRKTAGFLAGCCETGAIVGGATEIQAAALRSYGHHLGMAFQIADDLLDFLGDPQKTGKPLGTDLRDGRVTLPLIHALQVANDHDRRDLNKLLARKTLRDSDIQTLTETIARLGGFEAARLVAEARADRAVRDLDRFPDSPYKTTLQNLARYVVARDR